MDFEWDEAKRLSTLVKHRLDFRDAETVFVGKHIVHAGRSVGDEARWLVTGIVDDLFVTVVFTLRRERVRLISMRMARDDERQRHQAVHGH